MNKPPLEALFLCRYTGRKAERGTTLTSAGFNLLCPVHGDDGCLRLYKDSGRGELDSDDPEPEGGPEHEWDCLCIQTNDPDDCDCYEPCPAAPATSESGEEPFRCSCGYEWWEDVSELRDPMRRQTEMAETSVKKVRRCCFSEPGGRHVPGCIWVSPNEGNRDPHELPVATLDTPQEPPEPVAWMVRNADDKAPCRFHLLRNDADCDSRGFSHDTEVVPVYCHPPTDTPSAIYTDEDGNERCHVGGCKVTLVESDDGTCYYRAEPPTDTGEDG